MSIDSTLDLLLERCGTFRTVMRSPGGQDFPNAGCYLEIVPHLEAGLDRCPTLMLNGLYDFGTPVETAQRPLFARLGTPAEHKRHKVFEAGHTVPIEYLAGEILPWLDRYLGPVAHSSPGSTRTPAATDAR